MEGSDPAEERITSWGELIERLTAPARYPRFPELTATGDWRPWNAKPKPLSTGTTTVKQPKGVPPRLRRLFSNDRQYCRPLQYRRLPEDHIRLLDIRDARIDTDVLTGFKLITVPMSTAPGYKAISYCWGSTDLCTGILMSTRLHGKQVYRVTENLATCLHSLITSNWSDHKKPDYVWIDQICINQEDVAERNAQVRRMADIYSTATGVVVWLGQQTSFDMAGSHFEMWPDPEFQWRGATLLSWVEKWAIFGRPWFFRQWVFQEVVVARDIEILLGATHTIWEAIGDLRQTLRDFLDEDRRGSYDFLMLHTNALFYHGINATRRNVARQGCIDHPSFLQVMRLLDFQVCQDPRDKIYSIVGLAGDLFSANFVNYEQSVGATFQRCTRRLVEVTKDLEIITWLNPQTPDRRPSWVPQWHQMLLHGATRWLDSPSASRARVWKPPKVTVEDQLVVSGGFVDVVSVELKSFRRSMSTYFGGGELGEPLQSSYQEARNFTTDVSGSQYINDVRGSLTEARLEYTTLEPSPDFIQAFLRAVFCSDLHCPATDRETLFKTLNDKSLGPRKSEEAVFERFLVVGMHQCGRLLLLKSGRLAYTHVAGPGPATEDRVAILHGLNLPCLLRKSEDGEGWLFVSTIFVDGLMNGEGKCRPHIIQSITDAEPAVDWEEDEADNFILV
jgi:hypothetical protein